MTHGTIRPMTLDQLKAGQRGAVTALLGRRVRWCSDSWNWVILEGSEVKVVRRAIGGDPIEIELMGYCLSLRLDEARRIGIAAIDG